MENCHRYKGFNLLSKEDSSLFCLLCRGENFISGFTNKMLRSLLSNKTSGSVSRLLKRLLSHNLIKKVNKRYKYYLTEFGQRVILMTLKLREMVVLPTLASICWSSLVVVTKLPCSLCKNLTGKVLGIHTLCGSFSANKWWFLITQVDLFFHKIPGRTKKSMG